MKSKCSLHSWRLFPYFISSKFWSDLNVPCNIIRSFKGILLAYAITEVQVAEVQKARLIHHGTSAWSSVRSGCLSFGGEVMRQEKPSHLTRKWYKTVRVQNSEAQNSEGTKQ